MARSKILVVDDERMIRWSIQQALSKDGHAVATVETGEEAVAQATDDTPDLVLLDITLPGIDGIEVLRRLKAHEPAITVVMVTATEELKTAVEAMRLGAYDYVSKPFDIDRLRVIVQNALDRHELSQEVEFHRKESVKKYGFHRIIGVSRKLKDVVEIARKVAKSEAATVLLQGESGTGKDLLAQAIHYESSRATRPFIPINCTALPEELLESELMGHEKGAFTDAKTTKKGLFEVAVGGTIFLDEIGDMKPGLQAKLLRFIEGKAFRRVGGHRDISVDVRIIAATNSNLAALVKSGQFREDLFFRLNVIPIHIPPLRERREDILPLAGHYLAEFSSDFKRDLRRFSERAKRQMLSHDWPGNVRELRNVIERAIILGAEGQVDTLDLPVAESRLDWGAYTAGSPDSAGGEASAEPVGDSPAGPPEGPGAVFILPPMGIVLEDVERDFIRQALEMTQGNQTKAAESLGLTRDALRYRMKKYGFLQ
ncbi:MAG: sigma-54-dependent Fis family transcriptional regulator [Deltaproteobacteria bacterium]|nr:sigma-54-dependent Fis family transcriptional regulator [Deltaproteobacteria bacterium]